MVMMVMVMKMMMVMIVMVMMVMMVMMVVDYGGYMVMIMFSRLCKSGIDIEANTCRS